LLQISLHGAFVVAALTVAASCSSPASNGLIVQTEGTIPVSAREVRERGGGDRVGPEPAHQLHVLNAYSERVGLCEVNIRTTKSAKWSANQILLPNTCFYTGEKVIVTLPAAGKWQVRVRTSANEIATATVRVTLPVVEVAFGGP
jgi:hypothetical protein